MSAKFTPAPWHIGANEAYVFPDGHGLTVSHVASTIGSDRSIEEQKANARLIAAAPDLHALVRQFERTVEYLITKDRHKDDEEGARLKTFTLNLIRDVLAKVEGGAA
jgi:hypothetical protein